MPKLYLALSALFLTGVLMIAGLLTPLPGRRGAFRASLAAAQDDWPFTQRGEVWCRKQTAVWAPKSRFGTVVMDVQISGAFVFLRAGEVYYPLNDRAKLCLVYRDFDSSQCPQNLRSGEDLIRADRRTEAWSAIQNAEFYCE